MPSKKPLRYIKTAEAVTNKNIQQQQPQLLQKDFRYVKLGNNIENNNIEELKRKIDIITRYQKPYFLFFIILLINQLNFLGLLNIIISKSPIQTYIYSHKVIVFYLEQY